ncbi:MAG TPA: FKBP-type peptidyl-prolyl cis-trans isomerase [Ferruginibacter sp.]|nr:FKBP-type peptidyl-prolyl cis-trans isomerase [Ferruginibacter sp.]HMP20120.1 FKBP-type peptidyl-prolyl cis-trans isomerase [Ferruginibacter sp.]
MMRKLFLIALLPFAFLSCKKTAKCPYTAPTVVAPAAEVTALEDYLNTNGLTATLTKHSSGLYYKIDAAGSGTVPGVCSVVTVKYNGRLTSGASFDSNTTGVSFYLGELINGWKYGIPLIKSGGKITLYLPPSLGYGSTPVGSIPANSILIFDIELVNVSNN